MAARRGGVGKVAGHGGRIPVIYGSRGIDDIVARDHSNDGRKDVAGLCGGRYHWSQGTFNIKLSLVFTVFSSHFTVDM